MRKFLLVFIVLFSSHVIGEEIICEKYFRTFEIAVGKAGLGFAEGAELRLSLTLPEDDLAFEFIYKKNSNNVWTLNEMKLPNNINRIFENKVNEMFSNLKKAKKHKGDFTLSDFYKTYGLKLNFIKYQKMNAKDILSYVNQMSRKELNDYIDNDLLNQKSFKETYFNLYNDAGEEIRKKINRDGYYVKFDRYSEKNGKLILSNNNPELEGSIFDEGVKSVISKTESQLNKSTTEFWGVVGDAIYKIIYEGNCGNQINTTNNTYNDDDISYKLQKLKSLFENELITQEEYDSKRKEILDEM